MSSPVITSITPNHGDVVGGTPFTIIGTGFAAVASVSIGGALATSIVTVSSTHVTGVSPAHALFESVDVVLVNGDAATAHLNGGYQYDGATTWDTDAGDGLDDTPSNWTYDVPNSGVADAVIIGSGPAALHGSGASGHLIAKSFSFAGFTGALTEQNPGGFRSFQVGVGGSGADFLLSAGMTVTPFFNVDINGTGTLDTAGHLIAGFDVENFYAADTVVTLAGDTACYFAQIGYPGAIAVVPVASVCALGSHVLTIGGADWGGFLQLMSGARFTWTTGGKIVITTNATPFEMDTAATALVPLPPLEINGPGEVFQDFPEVPIYATSLVITDASLNGGIWNIAGEAIASGGGTITNCSFLGGSPLIVTGGVDGGGNTGVVFVPAAANATARDLLSRVPGILGRAFGHGATQWRAVVGSGTYYPLTDAHQGPVVEAFLFDADKQREVRVQQCTLTVPYSSSQVPAAGQVKTSDGLEWAIAGRSLNTQHGLMAYTLRRDPLVRFTPDRKATP